MKYVILHADDFGESPQVNAAILRAHCEGLLTSTSLMIGGSAWKEAVEQVRRLSSREFGVGLHLVVTEGAAVLPRKDLPHITMPDGRFRTDLFRLGLQYAFSKAAQRELRREIEAQFDRFASTGLEWSHVDGHQHFHLHPFIWETMLDCCRQFNVTRLRLPREEIRAHWRSGGTKFDLNTLATLIFRLLARRHRRRLPPHFFTCDRVYGHLQTGNMNADYLLRLADRLTGTTNEIYFHPGSPHARPLSPQTNGIADVESAALRDPAVRAAFSRPDITLGTYAGVADVVASIREREPVSALHLR